MAKGPFKVAHLNPAHPPHTHNALFMAPWLAIKPACVSSWLQVLQGFIHFMPERSLHPRRPPPSLTSSTPGDRVKLTENVFSGEEKKTFSNVDA